MEVVGAFSPAEARDGFGDGGPQVWNGAGSGFAEQHLESGEGLFDRVEVRAVGREVPQQRARGLDGASDAGASRSRQVVHDDDVAGRQRGNEDLLDLGQEGRPVHGAVEDHRHRHAAQAKAGREGGGLPVSMGNGGPAALAPPGPRPQPRHLGRSARLVDEDQLLGVEVELVVESGLPRLEDAGTLLLRRMRGLFLNVRPSRSRKV